MRFRHSRMAGAGWIAAGQLLFAQVAASTPPSEQHKPAQSAIPHDWTPDDDWRNSHDLETYSSICELDLPDSEEQTDAIVIDVDEIGTEPTFVSLQDGTRLKITRLDSDKLTIEMVGESEQLHPLPVDSRVPRTLPKPAKEEFDEELAQFQARYAELTSQGKSEQAHALAAAFLGDDPQIQPDDMPRRLPESLLTESAGLVQHRVSYNGKLARYRALFPSESNVVWADIAQRKITFTFRGATVDQAAEFLRIATGMSVEIDLPTSDATKKRIHVTCRDQAIESAMDAICRAANISYVVDNQRIRISEAKPATP